VLFGLRRELLPHVLFPVGAFTKAEIRTRARALGLPVHDKPDSQEICFVPGDDYLEFVRTRRPERETAGVIVDEEGTVLAEHAGIEAYTIGQRRGLGIAVGAPRYVVAIEPMSRTVTVGPRGSLERMVLEAGSMNWQGPVPTGPTRCRAQIRARHGAALATVEPLWERTPFRGAKGDDEGSGPSHPDRVCVRFDAPQSAITPGQAVTLYEDDLVLGGGWIERAIDPAPTAVPDSQDQPESTRW
jgi:tRNA-specific 2-thiouridylase